MDCNEIGRRLRDLRTQKHLKQEDVAKAINTSRANYVKMESGERDLKTDFCIKLAQFFDTTCDYILTGVSAKNVTLERQLGLNEFTINYLKKNFLIDRANNNYITRTPPYMLINALIELDKGRELMSVLANYLDSDFSLPVVSNDEDARMLTKQNKEYWFSYSEDDDLNIQIRQSSLETAFALEVVEYLKSWKSAYRNFFSSQFTQNRIANQRLIDYLNQTPDDILEDEALYNALLRRELEGKINAEEK